MSMYYERKRGTHSAGENGRVLEHFQRLCVLPDSAVLKALRKVSERNNGIRRYIFTQHIKSSLQNH
jgi:hypothetical protein